MAKNKQSSYLDELYIAEKAVEKRFQSEKEQHKCNNCKWAKWQEKLVFCMVPSCLTKK